MTKVNWAERDRDAVIAQIGAAIYEMRDCADKADCPEEVDDDYIRERNAEGWTVELLLPSEQLAGGYHDDQSYTRIEGVVLSPAELERALDHAQQYADDAEPWRAQLRTLHGGDHRRKGVKGLAIAKLAPAIPAGERTVRTWLAGTATPTITAQAAIERLYTARMRHAAKAAAANR